MANHQRSAVQITEEELRQLLLAEGINPDMVHVFKPQWGVVKAAASPTKQGRGSILVTPDLLVLSDGSVVELDEWISVRSMLLRDILLGKDNVMIRHLIRRCFTELENPDEAAETMCGKAQELLGWEGFINRLGNSSLDE